jgi:hypothetical protein
MRRKGAGEWFILISNWQRANQQTTGAMPSRAAYVVIRVMARSARVVMSSPPEHARARRLSNEQKQRFSRRVRAWRRSSVI